MEPNFRDIVTDTTRLGLEVVDDAVVTFQESKWPERIRAVSDTFRRAGNMIVYAARELPSTLRHRVGGAIVETVKDTFTYGSKDLNYLDEPKPAINGPTTFDEELGQGSE